MSGHDAPLKGPHQGQPVLTVGSPLDRAAAAMVLIHGRGGTAHDGPARPVAGLPPAGAQAGHRKGKTQRAWVTSPRDKKSPRRRPRFARI